MGVRIALGALPKQIVAQVLGEALRPLVAATAAGVTLAWLVLRTFRALFFEVSPSDIATFGAACALLLMVAAIAAFLPSRRAALVDPITALRGE
jgi:ABC-type antimicrobial peptide transport system permease subunit